MGRRTENRRYHSAAVKTHTLPSSPTHSSSSSDFEFIISRSPQKPSATAAADKLFYKGQILPLHLSPRLHMLLSSPSSPDSTTTASRDSTASTSSSLDCDSSRPSSAAEDEFKRLTTSVASAGNIHSLNFLPRKSSKYFSLAKFSSVVRKECKNTAVSGGTTVKRVGSTAKEVVRKYLKKVKPLYEKLSQKQQQQQKSPGHRTTPCMPSPPPPSAANSKDQDFITCKSYTSTANISHSFSGSMRFPSTRGSCISSCSSSMGSPPSFGRSGFGYCSGFSQVGRSGSGMCFTDSSSMEELQSAIQAAITHCKQSMLLQNKTMVSNAI